eukprot:4047628-Amphidinium_carterae.1
MLTSLRWLGCMPTCVQVGSAREQMVVPSSWLYRCARSSNGTQHTGTYFDTSCFTCFVHV